MLGGNSGRNSPQPTLPAGYVGGPGAAAGGGGGMGLHHHAHHHGHHIHNHNHAHGHGPSHSHKRKAATMGPASLLPPLPPLHSGAAGQPQHGLLLLTEVMREALDVLQLVEEGRQDEGLGLGLELKELSRLVTATVAVCQRALQSLTTQIVALLGAGSSTSTSTSTSTSSSSRYAAAAAAPPPPSSSTSSLVAPIPAAAAAPLPPAGAYYGNSRNAPSPEPQPYSWGYGGGEQQQQPEPAPDAACLEYLRACVVRAGRVLRRLRAREENYFGTFRAEVFLRELSLLEGGLASLLPRLSPEQQQQRRARRGREGEMRQRPLSGDEAEDGWALLEALEKGIPHPTAKIFWCKHFTAPTAPPPTAAATATSNTTAAPALPLTLVPWVAFARAFEEEFGSHPEEALERFKRALGAPPPAAAAAALGGSVMELDGVEGEEGPQYVVELGRFSRRTAEAGGLYELFQQEADPATLVYVMGTVEDDSHGHVVSFQPLVLDSFLGYSIEQVCCGGQHAAILTKSGLIYTWGRGGFGRLGHGDDSMCPAPRLVKALADRGVRCRQVACGFAYTAAVTRDGQVYTWGAGENGRLGLGDEQDKTTPGHVEELGGPLRAVKEIFAGSVHTCALLENGQIYSWGKCEYTGHGLAQDVWAPLHLDEFGGQPIVQVSVGPGGYHTIALSANGDVYTWGHNRVGQLGYTNSEAVPRNHEGAFFLPKPRVVESLRGLRVRKVIAGWGHSAVVCNNGDVFICGRNFQGQLGLGDPNKFERNERNHPYLAQFRPIKGLQTGQRVTQFACGGEHSAALLESDDVYTFGAGARGQLGHGEPRNEHFPRLNRAMKATRRVVKDLACGNNCTVLLVGAYRTPKLTELCLEAIADNWAMYEHIDFNEILPHELSSMLQRIRDAQADPAPDPQLAASAAQLQAQLQQQQQHQQHQQPPGQPPAPPQWLPQQHQHLPAPLPPMQLPPALQLQQFQQLQQLQQELQQHLDQLEEAAAEAEEEGAAEGGDMALAWDLFDEMGN